MDCVGKSLSSLLVRLGCMDWFQIAELLLNCVTRIQHTVDDPLRTVGEPPQNIHQSLQKIHQSLQNMLQESTSCLGQLCIVHFVILGWRLLGTPLA